MFFPFPPTAALHPPWDDWFKMERDIKTSHRLQHLWTSTELFNLLMESLQKPITNRENGEMRYLEICPARPLTCVYYCVRHYHSLWRERERDKM